MLTFALCRSGALGLVLYGALLLLARLDHFQRLCGFSLLLLFRSCNTGSMFLTAIQLKLFSFARGKPPKKSHLAVDFQVSQAAHRQCLTNGLWGSKQDGRVNSPGVQTQVRTSHLAELR